MAAEESAENRLELIHHGHRIRGREAGRGPRLWLIHGFPTSSHDWCALWPALVGHYRLQAIDMLGFGASDKPRRFEYTIAASADQWEALAARDGVEEVELIAHDYGDTVAQELLARQREGRLRFRIRRVVFLNGGLFPEATRPLLIQRALASAFGPVLARLLSQASFERSMRRICARPWPEGVMAKAWQLLEAGGGREVMPQLLAYIAERSRYRERWVGALQNADCPLALVNGVEDPISGASIARRWQKLQPQSSAIEMPGVGHYPQLEAPQALARALAQLGLVVSLR